MRCACGSDAVYCRRIEGRAFCGKCFSEQLERKVKKSIRQHGLLERGDTVAVGLSGGKDSSAVLSMLVKFFGKRPDINICAITVDEGIRGYRDRSIVAAKKFSKSLGVEHRVVRFRDIFGATLDKMTKAAASNVTACTVCGVLRRRCLNTAARDYGATKVCTGHNLDDEAQAVIMNYLKGDVRRLARMGAAPAVARHANFVPRIKPLREIPEREVALYAMLNGIKNYWGECPHARGIRFEVRDFLNSMEISHPGTKHGIVATFDAMLPSIRAALPKGEIGECAQCGEPASGSICKVCCLLRAAEANRKV